MHIASAVLEPFRVLVLPYSNPCGSDFVRSADEPRSAAFRTALVTRSVSIGKGHPKDALFLWRRRDSNP